MHKDPSTGERMRDVQVALNTFYADALFALAEHSRSQRSTAQGGPRILQRVAREWGITAADTIPQPRLTRLQMNPDELRR